MPDDGTSTFCRRKRYSKQCLQCCRAAMIAWLCANKTENRRDRWIAELSNSQLNRVLSLQLITQDASPYFNIVKKDRLHTAGNDTCWINDFRHLLSAPNRKHASSSLVCGIANLFGFDKTTTSPTRIEKNSIFDQDEFLGLVTSQGEFIFCHPSSDSPHHRSLLIRPRDKLADYLISGSKGPDQG